MTRQGTRPGRAARGPGPFIERPLDGVLGAKTAAALEKLGVSTVGDLLRFAPRRYFSHGELTPLRDFEIGEYATVIARVSDVQLRRMHRRQGVILTAHISDGNREMELTFFGKHEGAMSGHLKRLKIGSTGIFSGVVREYRGTPQLTHPDFSMTDGEDALEEIVDRHMRPIPVYKASAQIPSWRIEKALQVVLGQLTGADVPELIPDGVRRTNRLLSRSEAVKHLHQPETNADWEAARETLRYQEAFVLQSLLVRRRQVALEQPAVPRPGRPDGVLRAFDESLPFRLTRGQEAVGEELSHDLAGDVPMLRLLQGEVGSGKTVVALRAMLQVVDSGGQTALLAPTEVLAAQHFRSISQLMGDLAMGGTLVAAAESTKVVLLTAALTAAQRRESLAAIASGEAGIVVGTHALLSETVVFTDLGLVVVDEQHRFGVEQRDVLRNQGERAAHSLVMTATPIPRTVAMTVFGDLEVSQLTEVPAGRADVATFLVNWENARWVERMWDRCAEEVRRGGRVYVVCPRIDAHDDGTEDGGAPAEVLLDEKGKPIPPKRPLSAVVEVLEELRGSPALAGIEIGMLHGRMSTDAKERAMTDFASGRTPVLVATTVIEVGIDVPEAAVMVILDADRFGISQLHQLRGRIGRGTVPGVCFAVSTHVGMEGSTSERLDAFAASRDGFVLAERDLELRREGDVLGAAQSGVTSSLVTLRVLRDRDLIERAREEAFALLLRDPGLESLPGLRAELDRIEASQAAEFLDRT
ncbi:MAG TPA: ATP-dependent DNA helicase RecG [Actinomycetaceae bacterium]|nr:ATP-dependent DNA helicase RecG [Actinomycetaceae bacterium]